VIVYIIDFLDNYSTLVFMIKPKTKSTEIKTNDKITFYTVFFSSSNKNTKNMFSTSLKVSFSGFRIFVKATLKLKANAKNIRILTKSVFRFPFC